MESTRVALSTLARVGEAPGTVVTLPPERRSRHSDYVDLAEPTAAVGSTLLHATDVNSPEVVDGLSELRPDLIWVIGWSQIVGEALREIPALGVVGYHPSPLPRLRGRAVIPWTILLGERTTGGSLFWIDEGTDTGPLLCQEAFDVEPDETATTLYRKHMDVLGRLLTNAVSALAAGDPPRVRQDDDRASVCARRTWEDGRIDWTAPAPVVWGLVRATTRPYPGAFTYSDGRRVIAWSAELLDEDPRYIGIPGQVQSVDRDGTTVRCGDGRMVKLTEMTLDDGSPAGLRIHEVLDRRASPRVAS